MVSFIHTSNHRQPYPSWHNICLLRNPARDLATDLPCGLPDTFNASEYRRQYAELFPGKLPYDFDGSTEFTEKECQLSRDGRFCIDPACDFRDNSVNFALEFGLLYLLLVSCQLFVFLTYFDRDLHPTMLQHSTKHNRQREMFSTRD